MILVDTSVWVDHLRTGNAVLAALLEHGAVVGHPWVIGELALGHLGNQDEVLRLLQALPQAVVASEEEILVLIEREPLAASGIGYVDAQLLAATRLTPDTKLWTKNKRLATITARTGLRFEPGAIQMRSRSFDKVSQPTRGRRSR